MDTVRFGRALGAGAREAAKAIASAADAAAAPNPNSGQPSAARPANTVPVAEILRHATHQAGQARQTAKGIREGGRRFGEAAWGPFAKLGKVLWLEVTGVFFAIFAVFAGFEAWKDRGALRDGQGHSLHLIVAAGMALAFGYFCVSSFLKANRRGGR